MDCFGYRNSELMAEDVPLSLIAREVGTPVFVYSRSAFVGNLKAFDGAFAGVPHKVCYSVKVASNIALLSLAAGAGMGADIVSGGELHRALRAGMDPAGIVYSGVGKTEREMGEALDAGIMLFNVESEAELFLLSRIAEARGKVAPISVRVNPAVDPKTHPYIATGLRESKFGVPHEKALEMYGAASRDPWLDPAGVDCHIGSQLTEAAPFAEAVRRVKVLLTELRGMGENIRYFDLGGGLGITYNEETPPSPAEYAAAVLAALGDDRRDVTLLFEPGRCVAGNSCLMVTRVLYDKPPAAGGPHFVVIDGAMTEIIRPSFYGAFHGIIPVRETGAEKIKVNVVGPVCESGDFLAKGRLLQRVSPGDLLAVKCAGAYGFSMSSNYNSRRRAAEVLVEGGSFRVIREREGYADLIRGERV
jgi:diaminopimelate decarboxylase